MKKWSGSVSKVKRLVSSYGWLICQQYARSYFKKPDLLATLYPKYLEYIIESFSRFLEHQQGDETYVVAVKGVGSLFGFLKVKEVVEKLAPMVSGRLLVFFPGSLKPSRPNCRNKFLPPLTHWDGCTNFGRPRKRMRSTRPR